MVAEARPGFLKRASRRLNEVAAAFDETEATVLARRIGAVERDLAALRREVSTPAAEAD